MNIVIINTDCANLTSVRFSIERLGYEATITADKAVIQAADRVILPGVGTAKAAMRNLEAKDLVETIRSLQQPVLGICLGMQLLTAHSDEGDVNCLGVIPSVTQRLSCNHLPSPHMGWNRVTATRSNPLLEAEQQPFCYFVHSYAVAVDSYTIATSEYGERFAAMIQHNNFFGAQFHPEKSSAAGREIIRKFLEQAC